MNREDLMIYYKERSTIHGAYDAVYSILLQMGKKKTVLECLDGFIKSSADRPFSEGIYIEARARVRKTAWR